jgi:hypothetical protein
MKSVYLIVKQNINTNEKQSVGMKVYTSKRFAQKVATDYNDAMWDASEWYYFAEEFIVDEFQTTEDLHEEEE